MNKGQVLFKYVIRVGNATSQLLNTAFFNGEPNESISGRSYRLREESKAWELSRRSIDYCFLKLVSQEAHCRDAFYEDILNAQRTLESFKNNSDSEL